MKKFFAGVSVLAVVIGGLAGCGGPDRAAVQEKLEKAIFENTTGTVKENPKMREKIKCVAEKGIRALSDDQVVEFEKVLDEKGGKMTKNDIPETLQLQMSTASLDCTAIAIKDTDN